MADIGSRMDCLSLCRAQYTGMWLAVAYQTGYQLFIRNYSDRARPFTTGNELGSPRSARPYGSTSAHWHVRTFISGAILADDPCLAEFTRRYCARAVTYFT